MDNNLAIQAIDLTISNRKNEVIKSLIDSNVFVPNGISDLELKNLILKQLKEGNGFLVFYLGEVLDKEVLSSVANREQQSNWVGAAIGLASSLFGLATGGGGDDGKAQAQANQAAAAAEAARQAEIRKQMQIAQSQANAQKILAEAENKNRSSRTNRTVITISLIGGSLLIATIITVIILKKKK